VSWLPCLCVVSGESPGLCLTLFLTSLPGSTRYLYSGAIAERPDTVTLVILSQSSDRSNWVEGMLGLSVGYLLELSDLLELVFRSSPDGRVDPSLLCAGFSDFVPPSLPSIPHLPCHHCPPRPPCPPCCLCHPCRSMGTCAGCLLLISEYCGASGLLTP